MNVGATSITPRAVPFVVTQPDRIPKQRYYDKEFYALECERFWPRVWQMACRLEEIPKRGDYVVYDILDQSIIVMRLDERTIKAYYNACRHRGVQLLKDRGSRPTGVRCPFHGWSWNINGECTFVFTPEVFDERTIWTAMICGCVNAGSNAGAAAPSSIWTMTLRRLRDSIEPFATMHDAWHAETLRTEWWLVGAHALQLEAGHGGLHGGLSRDADAPPAVGERHSGRGPAQPIGVLGTEISPLSRYVTVPTEPRRFFRSARVHRYQYPDA